MDQPLNVTSDSTHTPSPGSQADLHSPDQHSSVTSDSTDTSSATPQTDQSSDASSDTTATRPTSDWTVMVYFAVDDPGQPGLDILQKLKEVGSTREVTILAHADPEAVGRPKSYLLQKGTKLDEDIRFRYVGPPHGPAFAEFVKWGLTRYPARQYILIIWGHGDGWQALDVALHVPGRAGRIQLQPRDMLDCQTLKNTLMSVLSDTRVLAMNRNRQKFRTNWKDGRGEQDMIKIDILGMDSCLMAMAEVGYQLRHSVDYLIACEEVEPISSWPYDYIFDDLVQHYDKLDPKNLARLIVRKYVISYKERMIDVTQSVLNLNAAEGLKDRVKDFAAALKRAYDCPLLRDAIMIARAQVQRYFETDYVDLYDFCRILVEETEYAKTQRVESETERTSLEGLAKKLEDACKALQEIIRGERRQNSLSDYTADTTGASRDDKCFSPIHGLYGFTVRNSYGTSIYFPCRDASNQYSALDFAKDTDWLEFLAQYAPARSHLAPSQDQEDQHLLGEIGHDKDMGRVVGSGTDGPVVAEPMLFPKDPLLNERFRSVNRK